ERRAEADWSAQARRGEGRGPLSAGAAYVRRRSPEGPAVHRRRRSELAQRVAHGGFNAGQRALAPAEAHRAALVVVRAATQLLDLNARLRAKAEHSFNPALDAETMRAVRERHAV